MLNEARLRFAQYPDSPCCRDIPMSAFARWNRILAQFVHCFLILDVRGNARVDAPRVAANFLQRGLVDLGFERSHRAGGPSAKKYSPVLSIMASTDLASGRLGLPKSACTRLPFA